MKEKELEGKTSIITGAGSGIGREIALLLARNGCGIIIIDLKGGEKLEAVKNRIENFGVTCQTYSGDTSKAREVNDIFSKIAQKTKRVDFLVNNAGYNSSQSFEEINEKEFDQEVAVNLKGVFLCSRAVLPLMQEKSGAIVNVSSVRGRTGSDTSSPAYAAAKAGVINLTKTLARQLGKYNIRANAVAPGVIYPTGLTQNYSKEKIEKISQSTMLKRLGTPREVAQVIYFLLSDLSSYITGQTLDVNGGMWMN